ncbi:hypothetical protein HDU67_005722, partial [Dinochytrium kinnereticum]
MDSIERFSYLVPEPHSGRGFRNAGLPLYHQANDTASTSRRWWWGARTAQLPSATGSLPESLAVETEASATAFSNLMTTINSYFT